MVWKKIHNIHSSDVHKTLLDRNVTEKKTWFAFIENTSIKRNALKIFFYFIINIQYF